MSTIDIRNHEPSSIDEIRFAEDQDESTGSDQASTLVKSSSREDSVFIYEGEQCDSIRLNGKEHAEYLIKAIEEAIKMGWLK